MLNYLKTKQNSDRPIDGEFIPVSVKHRSPELLPPEGSVAEWSARRTRNSAVPGSSPALATCWICARSSRVQILGHACK